MKNRLMIIKKYLVFSFVALLPVLKPVAINAQPTIIPATLPDNGVTVFGAFGYPNCSSIDYTPFNAGLGPLNPQLTAVVTGVGPSKIGGPIPMLWINDQVGGWVPVPIPGPITPTSPTDVVVGNDIGVPGTYRVAVVYTALNSVWLMNYAVTGTGAGGPVAVAPVLGFPINISGVGMVIGAPHIDMITEYSNPYPAIGGLPRANKFVVTWEQSMLGGAPGIWAYSSTLVAPPVAGPAVLINPNNLAHLPDVAGVQRQKPSGLFEDWALFTYEEYVSAIDRTNKYIAYQEWNVSANQVWPPTVYDIKPLVDSEFLRIDAIDNYVYNNPGPDVYPTAPPATNAFFCIAVTANTNGASDILAYNNITGLWKATNISNPPGLGGQKNLSPVVACGPGPNYTIAYNSKSYAAAYAPYFATSISWSSGLPNSPGDAYGIPTTAYGFSGVPDDGVAIAGTCNKDGLGFQSVFPCWQNNNQIWGKYTNTVAYTFKGGVVGVPALSLNEYEIMPNPASDYIILAGPENTFTRYRYQVTDIAGRTLLHASINSPNEKVSVRDLASGVYILNIYNNELPVNTFRLVKQ